MAAASWETQSKNHPVESNQHTETREIVINCYFKLLSFEVVGSAATDNQNIPY